MSENHTDQNVQFTPSYFNMPLFLLNNKNISKLAIAVYQTIRMLSNKDHGCWASNGYFSAMFDAHPSTISGIISTLKKEGLIKVAQNGPIRYIKTSEDIQDGQEEKKIKNVNLAMRDEMRERIEEFKKSRSSKLNIEKFEELLKSQNPEKPDVASDNGKSYATRRRLDNTEDEGNRCGRTNQYISSISEVDDDLSSSKEEEQLCGVAASVEDLTEVSWRNKKDTTTTKQTHHSENNINQPLKNKKINQTIYNSDTDPYEIINKWNNSGLMYIDPQRSRTAASQLSALMRGDFFATHTLSNGHSQFINRPFSKNDILSAIENRARAACDPTYSPVDPMKKSKMRKLPFYLWLYNAKTAESQFLKDFEKPPKSARRKVDLIPDEQPDHTEAVKEAYIKSVLYGIEPITPWSTQDENDFRNAGVLLWEFFERNSPDISSYFTNDPEKKAKYLINAIRSNMSDDEKYFPVKWLCSDNTFMKFLPSYLGYQRITRKNPY